MVSSLVSSRFGEGFRRPSDREDIVYLDRGQLGLTKEMTMRPRPFAVLHHVRLLVSVPRSYAFPSGHTTNAFAASSGAVLVAKRFLKRVPFWGWSMLALAAAISYSRVYVGVHWPTDVAASVLLGLANGWAG